MPDNTKDAPKTAGTTAGEKALATLEELKGKLEASESENAELKELLDSDDTAKTLEELKGKLEALEQEKQSLLKAAETSPGAYEVGKIGKKEGVIQNVRTEIKKALKPFVVKQLVGGKVDATYLAKALDESFAKSIVIDQHRLPMSTVLVVEKAA